ncbi:hypothetical protein Sinac_6190 [Singulisphaera acidiphila DSM 18658]|uniref:Uncharacterized protein n=1 Tax=Singulisphaera acidiphila (strain ATCC BAA-1392 / DSM 18658 / VKM B-2454 / MOB10) TaxID=886293 RepID=L0DLM6_SINAD|nr:hypothetical protein Sinac_6190 [Singulisphaera acidiphila DSM 18658]
MGRDEDVVAGWSSLFLFFERFSALVAFYIRNTIPRQDELKAIVTFSSRLYCDGSNRRVKRPRPVRHPDRSGQQFQGFEWSTCVPSWLCAVARCVEAA